MSIKKNFDLPEVSHKELREELIDAFDSLVPLYVWGMPGIGKSYACAEVAQELANRERRLFVDWNRSSRAVKHAVVNGRIPKELFGQRGNAGEVPAHLADCDEVGADQVFLFADYRLSQRDPSDITGLPCLDHSFVEWKPAMVFYALSMPAMAGLLLLDEIPQAMPVMQNAAYQLIQDRCCGEISFSDKVAVVAAGNRITDGGHQFQIPPALANRFTHVELTPPGAKAWSDWAIDHGVDGRVVGFLNFMPASLLADMTDVRKNHAMAWASPRAWDKASAKIKSLPAATNAQISRVGRKVASAVGLAHSVMFEAFLKTSSKLDLAGLLKHPADVKAFDLQMKWALISAVAEHYREDKKALDDILGLCGHLTADFAVSMLRLMRRHDAVQFAGRLVKCKNRNVALDYLKYFEG